jgi:RsiW-degrading membrane proteinase PrsW (M82 family)
MPKLAGVLGFRGPSKMSRNLAYLVIAVLAVAVVVLGYQYYQDQQNTAGIHIKIGNGGASIEAK